MKDEDVLHPGHRSIRLRDHDYSSPGFYFVTICTRQKLSFFGRIASARMELNRLGQIVLQSGMGIPEHFAHVNVHAFITMPNHLHGIIEIGCHAGAQHAAPLQEVVLGEVCRRGVAPGSLSSVVRSFKAAVTVRARKELDWKGDVWQRNYFERTLRDGQEFSDASRYISENPMKCEQDRENPKTKRAVDPEAHGGSGLRPC